MRQCVMNLHIGMQTINRIKEIETKAAGMGFAFATDGRISYGQPNNLDLVSLVPLENMLPVYSRDAILFTGTLDQVETFLIGISWSRDYDWMLNISNPDKRYFGENKYREDVEKKRIKDEQTKMWKMLKETKDVSIMDT